MKESIELCIMDVRVGIDDMAMAGVEDIQFQVHAHNILHLESLAANLL